MSVDGTVRSPLVTDYGRWRRVVVQTPTTIGFQRMDDTFVTYGAVLDAPGGTITLSNPANKSAVGRLAYERPSVDRLRLDGTMDGRHIGMPLRRFDEKNFLLRTRGFHWVQEYPFNR